MFIDFQGFATDEDFTIMAVKDVPYMIKNNNSIHQQSVILGVFHQHRIQALIHWARYQKRRGIAIVPGNWNNAALANAIERVNFETPSKEVERPGKLEDLIKWTVWETKWENYLGSIFGASSIPLDYVIRRDMTAVWIAANDAVNEHDRLKYQAQHVGTSYDTDKMTVYGELKACCLDSECWEWIKIFDVQKDGLLAMLSL